MTALGIKLPISGDDNFSATVSVRYRESGQASWQLALPLFRVHPESTSPYVLAPHFAGSIFDLRPATTYQIELTVQDPDGPLNRLFTLTGTTRAVPGDPANPRVVNVSNVTSFQAALAAAQAGDVITLANGVYTGQFSLYASGTAANPIVVRGASQDGVILDGNNCEPCNVFEAYGSWTHIERLALQNGQRATRFQTAGAEGNVIRRVRTRNTTFGFEGRENQRDFYYADNTLEGRLTWPLIFTDDGGVHASDEGIVVWGFGHVVAHNRISGFGDAMKTMQYGARALDFYGNDIIWTYDNGVELDGGEGNVRLLRNRFTNTYEGISTQPILGGPAYIIRNTEANNVFEQIKMHSGPESRPNGILAYHNTFVSSRFGLAVQSGVPVNHFALLNNLFIGPAQPVSDLTVDFYAPINDGLFDYNGYWPDKIFAYLFPSFRVKAFSFAELQTSGIEPHGVLVNPQVLASGLVGQTDFRPLMQPQNMALSANSIALNRGVRLANVNDGFQSTAPDLGALESGCPAPPYGPRAEGTNEANIVVDCPPTPPVTCAVNLTASVAITRSGFRLNNATKRWVQTVSVRNTSGSPITGPLSLAIDGLSANAALAAQAGSTACGTPLNSPFVNVNVTGGTLAAGASAAITLEFLNPTNQAIVYVTRILAGEGTR